ncbi:MAG: hypothetical protein KF773_21745 [Deltaproteobacteria bacterium]|nr:hypothetical protein [Deltaproteobacteria bacterium]
MSGAKGQIHDLGYKRYVGTRRPPSTRWRVIARHQISFAWKTWWRFKAALGIAIIATCITSGLMLFASERSTSVGLAQAIVKPLIDSALPESIIWFCRAGFLVSLTIGAGVVASDVQSGAFTFYFARSVKPFHYVAGKLVGLCALLAIIVFAGPMVISGLRVGIADSPEQLIEMLPYLGKTAIIGAVATLAYAAVPLGFSALLHNRRHALALWAAYYLIFGEMMHALGRASDSSGWIAAIDIPHAVQALAYDLYDIKFRAQRDANIPVEAAVVALAAHVVLAIAIVLHRVRAAQRAGIGGGA